MDALTTKHLDARCPPPQPKRWEEVRPLAYSLSVSAHLTVHVVKVFLLVHAFSLLCCTGGGTMLTGRGRGGVVEGEGGKIVDESGPDAHGLLGRGRKEQKRVGERRRYPGAGGHEGGG